ncbi:MAG TPA: hypothetical protein VJT50_12070 [Pyrinomonadaceae bacterium]|nr:hypothetical protein [Pyrinomonadaceae bacterium]
MLIFLVIVFAQVQNTFNKPTYFGPVIATMFLLGAIGWLVATVLGFARARAFGSSTRWFTFSAVCLLLFHLQFLAVGFGVLTNDTNFVFTLLTFFNFFVILGAICSIIGFIRLTTPR